MPRFALPLAALALALALGSACAPPPVPCSAAPALDGLPDTVAVAQGSRAFVPAPARDGVVVGVEGLAPGFTLREQDGRFVVGAPYGVAGKLPARFVATCTDAGHDAAAHPFIVDVRAPAVHPIASDAAPSPRSLVAAAVVGDALIAAGGTADGVAAVDVWRLDLASDAWSPLSVASPPSPARAAALDDGHAIFLASDGTSFVLDVAAGTLSPLADKSRPAAALRGAFAPSGTSFVSACGAPDDPSCAVSALAVDDSGGSWTPEEATGFSPSGRAGVAYGVDVEGGRLVLFGGQSTGKEASSDTWSLDTAHLADGVVTFAHLGAGGADPPARVDACGVVDPVGRRFFVFGGENADGIVQDPWVLDLDHADARWRPAPIEGVPGRAGCIAVYDAARARILVGFGHDDFAERNDVYAIDL